MPGRFASLVHLATAWFVDIFRCCLRTVHCAWFTHHNAVCFLRLSCMQASDSSRLGIAFLNNRNVLQDRGVCEIREVMGQWDE